MSLYGICILTTVPGREDANDRSEMVTQLLFGEHFHVLQKKRKWSLIKMAVDGYECWIDNKQYKVIPKALFDDLESLDMPERMDDDIIPVTIDGQKQFLLKGAVIESSVLSKFKVDIQTRIPTERMKPVQYARQYLNAPYLWGGRSLFGIDCSGLMQMCHLLAGRTFPRDAWQQAELGVIIDFVEEAREGDLAFFDNDEGKIVHVGMVLQNSLIIHASGKVRIDRLDHQGIYNKESKNYTHKLRLIKRLA